MSRTEASRSAPVRCCGSCRNRRTKSALALRPWEAPEPPSSPSRAQGRPAAATGHPLCCQLHRRGRRENASRASPALSSEASCCTMPQTVSRSLAAFISERAAAASDGTRPRRSRRATAPRVASKIRKLRILGFRLIWGLSRVRKEGVAERVLGSVGGSQMVRGAGGRAPGRRLRGRPSPPFTSPKRGLDSARVAACR